MQINLTTFAQNSNLVAQLKKAVATHNLISVREFLLKYFPSKFITASSMDNLFDAADVLVSIGEVYEDGDNLDDYLGDLMLSLKQLERTYYQNKKRAQIQYARLTIARPNFEKFSQTTRILSSREIKNSLEFLNAIEAYYSYLDGFQAQKKAEISYLISYLNENAQNKTHETQDLFNVDASLRRA